MLFTYSAKTYNGKDIKSEIEASSREEAIKILRDKKMIVLDLKEIKSNPLNSIFGLNISTKDKLIFIQELAVVLESGMPLVEALENLGEQTSNKKLKKIIEDLSIDVRGGKSFSDSLSKFPNVFSHIFISIIKSGEKSGKMDQTLKRLAEQTQKDYDLQSKVKNALLYPIVILVALTGVLILSLIYVIPQIKKIFEEMDVELPLLTRVILGISSFLTTWWWLFIIIIAGLFFIFLLMRRSLFWKSKWDSFKLKIPIYGPYVKKIYMANFARNLQTMSSAGISINESLIITKDVLNNQEYAKAMDRISNEVENGSALAASIRKEKIFPLMVSQLISVGEKSGKIDFVLETLSNFYDREVEATTRNLTTVLEPVLTILIGIAVALFIASVIMPIYGLVNVI